MLIGYSFPLRNKISASSLLRCGGNDNILTGYYKEEVDITSMFTAVSYALWISTLISYITFVCLLRLGKWHNKSNDTHKSPEWLVACAFLFENNFPENTL